MGNFSSQENLNTSSYDKEVYDEGFIEDDIRLEISKKELKVVHVEYDKELNILTQQDEGMLMVDNSRTFSVIN